MNTDALSRRRRFLGVLVILSGFLVHLVDGTYYTFGNMSPYIVSYLRKYGHPSDITPQKLVWVYALLEIGLSVAVYVGGQIDKKLGPRLTVLLGGLLLGAGVALTYFTIVSYWLVMLTYGLLFGFGMGVTYSIPMACAMSWWPNREGLVTGFVVAGSGASAILFDQVQTQYINPHKQNPSIPDPDNPDQKYFGDADLLHRVKTSFLVLGGTYFAMLVIGSIFLIKRKDVSTNIQNEGEPLIQSESDGDGSLTPAQLLRDKRFYMLWTAFFCLGQAVTFISSLFKAYGLTFINDDHFMALVGSISSPFNALGRIFWGFLSDKFSLRVVLLSMCAIFTALILSFNVSMLGGKPVFAIWVCLLFSCFGGIFCLFPALTARAFGQTHFSSNYGLLFSSQMFGACLSASLSLLNVTYNVLWFSSAGLTFLAVLLIYFLKI
ncbi:L-lactate transporter-like [Oscarella lobularis]|uniref:L-lactate transporter-like n=1 Tax=Oscarella lobularis TaxID=121494 RepID=UPI00331370FA